MDATEQIAELFAGVRGKYRDNIIGSALHLPVTIAFYTALGCVFGHLDKQQSVDAAVVAWPVTSPNYHPAKQLPLPDPTGEYVYIHAIASRGDMERSQRTGRWAVRVLQTMFPQAKWFYAYRGGRKTRLMPLFKEAVCLA